MFWAHVAAHVSYKPVEKKHFTTRRVYSVSVCVAPEGAKHTSLQQTNISQYLRATHLFIQRVEEDGGLDRLSQTHLVSQDGVRALSPGESQPVESLQLVGVQRPPCAVQVLRLTLKLYSRLGTEKREDRFVSAGQPQRNWGDKSCKRLLGKPFRENDNR